MADEDEDALRSELIATSPLCKAIFETWPDATPKRSPVITVAWFPRAKVSGPALGEPETMPWFEFRSVLRHRREDNEKDGACFSAARFKLEPDGKHVRRLQANAEARTAVVLDVETDAKTGEIPPPLAAVGAKLREREWASVVYTSHSHTAAAPRYRVVLPLSAEIDPNLPVVELVAEQLGLVGVVDASKAGAGSLFYLPSCPPGESDKHSTEEIDGRPLDAPKLAKAAAALLAERQAEDDRLAAVAHAEAEQRRQAKIDAGFNPDDSLIEKIRAHLDLEQILLNHGYAKQGNAWRHPNSTSGSFGANVKTLGGVPRIHSLNANDPLHADNLPDGWRVKAVDAIDATIILDYGGDRKKALRELAQRFGLIKAADPWPEKGNQLAALMSRKIREKASQEAIEATVFAEAERLGMTRAEVITVASWVAAHSNPRPT